MLLSVLAEAPELDPGVTLAVLVFAEEQVPFDALGRVTVGLSMRWEATSPSSRKGSCSANTRDFAGAVVAAQQEVALLVVELLPVLAVEVQEPAAQRLPALAPGAGQAGIRELPLTVAGGREQGFAHRFFSRRSSNGVDVSPGPSGARKA